MTSTRTRLAPVWFANGLDARAIGFRPAFVPKMILAGTCLHRGLGGALCRGGSGRGAEAALPGLARRSHPH